MEWFEALVLGALQGVTEFLPISSSGHLVLGEVFLRLKVETLKSFDVAVHVGTLLAILIYFWKDVLGMIKTFFKILAGRLDRADPYAWLIFYVLVGTVPAALAGLFLEDQIDAVFRNVVAVGSVMIVVAIMYLLGEFMYKKDEKGMNLRKAVVVGLAQAVALIPGISRSGSTIVAGLFQGIDRATAARFSFLLGIPAIAGAGLLTALKVSYNGGFEVAFLPLAIGFVSSLIFGLLSVSFLMKYLKKHSLKVFSVYLIAMGLAAIFS